MFQPTLEDLGQPLAQTTFVVVDLETTGGSPEHDRITEFGAVKIRAGEVLGELSTLVDPGQRVPTEITMLTGISNLSVRGRPPVSAVLPSFLEFSRGAALVAHNAHFDVGFLNAALQRLGYPLLDNPVVCTAQLARRLVGDEVRNRRLSTLAHHFRSSTVPIHRALADARATVDVFHGLVEQAGTFGVVTLEDLIAFSRVRNMPLFTSRRKMADGLPAAPGVYRFVSAAGEVLYVGKATDLRARVRQYFGTDTRRRIAELVRESARVEHTVTPTVLQAEITEVRLIRQHRPRFNRRGKGIRPPVWVVLTTDAYPRLSIVRAPPPPDRTSLGPLPSRVVAQAVVDAIHEAVPIRRCTTAMKAPTRFSACVLAEIGRCAAPCIGGTDPDSYGHTADDVAVILGGDVSGALTTLQRLMTARAGAARFEEAAQARDRMDTLLGWVIRTRRDTALRAAGLVVASRPGPAGRREVMIQRGGWLLTTAVVTPVEICDLTSMWKATPSPDGSAPPDELTILQRWLASDRVRLDHTSEGLAWPVAGGAEMAEVHHRVATAKSRTGRPGSHLSGKRVQRGKPSGVRPGSREAPRSGRQRDVPGP
ncbi:MAG: DEDD exonuclease domain-containing protein [Euzebya sp.]